MRPAFVWSPTYEMSIGRHVFPTQKFRLVKELLVSQGLVREDEVEHAPKATDDEMLAGIRRLKAVHGFLSSSLIDAAPDLPGSNFYKRRFGTILKAYALAGFDTTRAQLVSAARRRSRDLFPSSYPLLNPPPA